MVKVRVLSRVALNVDFKTRFVKRSDNDHQHQNHGCCFLPTRRRLPPLVTKIDSMIIHMHGGGFVAMSSSTH
jgi:hypothetical protein